MESGKIFNLANDIAYSKDAVVSKTIIKKSVGTCLLYTSPSPRDRQKSRMPSSA